MSNRKLTSSHKRIEKFRSLNATQRSQGPQASDVSTLTAVKSTLDEPHIKSNIAPVGDDLELRLTYNKYLQALLKQQFIENQIAQHVQSMNDQMLQQSHSLQMAKNTLEQTNSRIRSFEDAVECNEWLQRFKITLSELEQLYSSCNITAKQQDFSNILSSQLEQVSISNVQPIESQQEFNQLHTTLEKLGKVLNHISSLHKDVQDIQKLANSLKELTHLNSEISQAIQRAPELNQKCILQVLVSASDAFARAYE
ncbi:hypothetical protein D910_11383 [Dendroctonus ponderosae]